MTLILGFIAVVLLIVVVGAAVLANRDDEVLSFTQPGDLADAAKAAAAPTSIAPLQVPDRAAGSIDIAPSHAKVETLQQSLEAVAPARPSAPGDFYPGNLGVGTVLTYRGVESRIFAVISFDFAGELWQDYLAEHGSGQWWRFGVEPDRGMKLAAFQPQPLAIEPGPETLVHNGETYRMTESGEANYRTAGQTNLPATGAYAYFDYENNGREILSFERFDNGAWITSIGHHVNPTAVTIDNHRPAD